MALLFEQGVDIAVAIATVGEGGGYAQREGALHLRADRRSLVPAARPGWDDRSVLHDLFDRFSAVSWEPVKAALVEGASRLSKSDAWIPLVKEDDSAELHAQALVALKQVARELGRDGGGLTTDIVGGLLRKKNCWTLATKLIRVQEKVFEKKPDVIALAQDCD